MFESQNVELADDAETIAQLSVRRYTLTSSGRLEVESKKEMKKRGLDSPDRADALALSVYLGKVKKHMGSVPGADFLSGLTKSNYWNRK